MAAILLAAASPLAAQAFREPARFAGEASQEEDRAEAGRAFLLSAVLPGAGQYYLGRQRWVPYLALEAWAWISYAGRRAEARDLEERYRDLAWSVARRVGVGARRDTTFEYYEALTKRLASGAFDLDPRSPGVQPETDTTTFNGRTWALARGIFLPGGPGAGAPDSPQFEEALRYYESHAIRPEYAWSWGQNELEQQVYAELIHASDEAVRDATRALGFILVNHLTSAVEALVTARLRSAGAGSGLRFDSLLEPDGRGLRWRAGVQVPWPVEWR